MSVTNRIPLSVNSVLSLSVVDVLQDHHSERFLDMIIPAFPAPPQVISRVNTNTCCSQAQKCLDESTKPHSKFKAEWLALVLVVSLYGDAPQCPVREAQNADGGVAVIVRFASA